MKIAIYRVGEGKSIIREILGFQLYKGEHNIHFYFRIWNWNRCISINL